MEITQVEISDLKPNDKNPRRISKREHQKLVRSIREFGLVDPIIVNKNKSRYNIVIGGHQRLNAAKKIGMKKVPVVYVDFTEERESLLNVALNEISGEWDDDKLFELLKELQAREVDITLTGFDEPILDEILSGARLAEKESLIDIVPKTPIKPKTQPGEVWKLGKHRLMCGNSTKPEDFKKLMNGKIGDMCWTDPPYGVSYKGTNNPNGREWEILKNDNLREDDLYKFLFKIYSNVEKHLKKNAAIYSCYATINHRIFETALNESGMVVKQVLIWAKGHVLGHSDYHWTHEPILYCRKVDNQPGWFGDRTHKTVILNNTIEDLEKLKKEELISMIAGIRLDSDLLKEKKDPSSEYLHSTQKPVGLSKRLIKNSSRPNELVIEPCAGSGSTLMACETSGRVCYAMEIDERYCDVILTRWAQFTEKKPTRESDGKEWGI